MSATRTPTTVEGLYPAQAKNFAKKFFKEHFDKFKHVVNGDINVFEIEILDKVKKEDLKRFSDMYPTEFNIIVVTKTPYKKLA